MWRQNGLRVRWRLADRIEIRPKQCTDYVKRKIYHDREEFEER